MERFLLPEHSKYFSIGDFGVLQLQDVFGPASIAKELEFYIFNMSTASLFMENYDSQILLLQSWAEDSGNCFAV